MIKRKYYTVLFAMAIITLFMGMFMFNFVSAEETTKQNVKVVYKDENADKTSANLKAFEITSFESESDFTDYFKLRYNYKDKNVNNYITYSESDKTLTLSAEEKVGFAFMPDNEFGYAEFGNFEVSFTLKPTATSGKHVFFGSRIDWDTGDLQYGKAAKTILSNGNQLTTWGDSSKVSGGANVTLSQDFVKVTLGFIDNAWYWYIGTAKEDASNCSVYTKPFVANTANAARDGNQIFAIDMLQGATVEIKDFSFKRLDIEYAAATATTEESAEKAIEHCKNSFVKEEKTYADELFYDFTDASKFSENQEFLDGLYQYASTYSEIGTVADYVLQENGYRMKNSSENSYGVSWKTMTTKQYVNSVVMLDLEVKTGNFELFLRTKEGKTDNHAADGYHVVVSVINNYAYLKLESRVNGKYTAMGQVNLANGNLKLCVVTEKVTVDGSESTRIRLFTSGVDPVIDVIDSEIENLENRVNSDAGNIAFGVRNQTVENSVIAAETLLKKIAIYSRVDDFKWPNQNFGGQEGVGKIADFSYIFDNDNMEKTQEFIEKVSVRGTDSGEGSITVGEKGEIDLKNGKAKQYARTEYAFNALNLGNYTVMAEIEVIEGSLVFAVRTPTFANIQGDSVYVQLTNNGDGGGLYVAMVKRSGWKYSAYFTNFQVNAYRICLQIKVQDNKISLQINDYEPRYNIIEETGLYDDEGIKSGGDFVIATMNDLSTDIASSKLYRLAFYNGVTAKENVDYNYTKEEQSLMTEAELSEAYDKAEKNLTFIGGFYEKTVIELALLKEYDGKKEFKLGDTIKVNVMEYLSTNALTEELIIEELGGRGVVTDGVWTYKLEEENDFAFVLSIGHDYADPVLLKINVTSKPQAESSGCSCGSSIYGIFTFPLIALAVVVCIKKLKRD